VLSAGLATGWECCEKGRCVVFCPLHYKTTATAAIQSAPTEILAVGQTDGSILSGDLPYGRVGSARMAPQLKPAPKAERMMGPAIGVVPAFHHSAAAMSSDAEEVLP